jgi:hypothetical protein
MRVKAEGRKVAASAAAAAADSTQTWIMEDDCIHRLVKAHGS